MYNQTRPLSHSSNAYINYARILCTRLENTDEETILSFYKRLDSCTRVTFFLMKSKNYIS